MRSLTLRGLLTGSLVCMATLGAGVPAQATSRTIADPAQGPHVLDEARHAGQRFQFAPAHTAIIARQPKAPARRLGPAGAAPNTAGAPGALQREVFGFAPYWELSQNPNWNYTLLSTVAYFGVGIHGDGSLDTTDSGWSGWTSQNLATIINGAHQAGDRVVVVIKPANPAGGSTAATVNSIVTSSNATQAAITNTVNLIASKSLDGVNVDFEGTSTGYPNVQAGFTNFITQLSAQVHQRWPSATVSADTYGGSASWDGGIFKIGDLAQVADFLFIMAYDSAQSNTPGKAGPTAPLNGWTYNDTNEVSQYLTKAPPSKVVLGVPYYGYKWSTTTNSPYGTAQPGSGFLAETYSGVAGDFACALQLSKQWDTTAQSPWAYWWSPASGDPCGGNHNSWRELYYDDATSLEAKYDLVNSSGLLGTGMWALGYDGSSPDLWQALADKFLTPWPGQYHPLVPTRIVDTRDGTGGMAVPMAPGQTANFTVTGRGGVPATGVAAVVLNVTAIGATAPSYLTVFPAGSPRPNASNLNFVAGETVPNLVEVAVGKGGKVSVYNFHGGVHVVFDVAGWVSTAWTTSGTAGLYQPIVPARLLDTRDGTGGFTSPLGAGQTLDLPVTGLKGVPASGASAVVLNITAINPTNGSFISAYPTGAARPNVSNVNFMPGQLVPNRAIVQVGTGGKVTFYNLAGTVDVVVDVGGWFTDGTNATTGSAFTGLTPARILDTRYGIGGMTRPIPAGTTVIQVAGLGGVPAMSATTPPTAVVMNVTVANPTAPGFLTVYPGGSRPVASDLNFTPGKTIPNLVVARLAPDGSISIYNLAGTTDVIIDVMGFYS